MGGTHEMPDFISEEEVQAQYERQLAALSPERKLERDALEAKVKAAWTKTQDERFQRVTSDANNAEFTRLSSEHTEAQQALNDWESKNLDPNL